MLDICEESTRYAYILRLLKRKYAEKKTRERISIAKKNSICDKFYFKNFLVIQLTELYLYLILDIVEKQVTYNSIWRNL